MSPVAQTARRCDLHLAKFYRKKAIAALAQARQARWIGREAGVAHLVAEALWWRRFSNRRAQRARQEVAR
jgi:hypothetical protein